MKKIRLIEVKSELGAGKRGASLGVDALKIACLNKESDYFKRFTSVEVPNFNDVMFEKNIFPHAKYIDSILQTYKRISHTVERTLEVGMFPLVLAGDHSNAGGTIAGIKATYPDKTLGVIWVDAHADIHSPYTSPSGNMHGMPLAASLSEDNLECKVNEPDQETIFFWESLKKVGVDEAKIKHEHIVYIVTRSYEKSEVFLFDKHNIKNFTYPEVIAKGVEQVAEEALHRLKECDLIYVSFDVDSLDSKFSKGTGTPVEVGLNVDQAKELCYQLVSHPKVVCFEMVEINPTLDTQNIMAQNAFDILEHTTMALEKRLDQEA